jgi:hypothetical protein
MVENYTFSQNVDIDKDERRINSGNDAGKQGSTVHEPD